MILKVHRDLQCLCGLRISLTTNKGNYNRNKMKLKKQIIIGLSLWLGGSLQGQETGSYLHFNVGGGLHNLLCNIQNSTEKGDLGCTINAAYSYFFTPQWGVQTGLGIQSFNALSTLNLLSSTTEIDTDGDAYAFRVHYQNWKEKQQVLFFDIPLALQYRYAIGKSFGILGSAGGKISIPVNASYKTTGGEIVTTGYYSQWNVEFKNMPQHGFSTINNSYKGDLTLKPSYMAIADLGGLVKLSEKADIYIGAYINSGLNNILKADVKYIYQWNGVYNGVFASTQTAKINTISVGVKVGLYLKLGRKTLKYMEKHTMTNSDKDSVHNFRNICSNIPKEAIGLVDKEGCPLDTDGDGVPDYLDRCSETPKAAKGKVDKTGCPLDTVGGGIPDYLEECPTIVGVAFNNGCLKIKKEAKVLFKKAL